MTRFTVRELSTPSTLRASLVADVLEGFAKTPKSLPPKYFYDVEGSEIFEAITELPEYYVTRAETAALIEHAATIIGEGRWSRLLELGSGSSTKTRTLLDAMHEGSRGRVTYAPLDISPSAVAEAAEALTSWADWLDVEGCIVDFQDAAITDALRSDGPQLAIMLGSTLGNLYVDERDRLFSRIADALGPDDAFLFGLDLVKGSELLEPAYNDSAGVTEEFIKNVIRVIQRELGASCTPDDFRYHAPYVADLQRMEMRLYAKQDLTITFEHDRLPRFRMAEGEYLLTEISQKFEREPFTDSAAASGLRVDGWWTDGDENVAIALLRAS